jgi:hypothetical protein
MTTRDEVQNNTLIVFNIVFYSWMYELDSITLQNKL